LQAYSCSLVRGVLEDALRGRLTFVDGVVFPHTCDSIQRLSDIWRMNVPSGFHLDAVLPVKLNTDSAREYLRDVTVRFHRELAQRLGAVISDDALRKAIALYNRLREGLRALYRLRCDHPGALSSRALHTVTRAAMVMDRAHFVQSLDALYAEAAARRIGASKPKRLVLSGGLCSMPDVYGVIEAAGAAVVWDDLCTGARYFDGPIDPAKAPLEGIADRYAERVVCPAKHMNLDQRGAHLLRLVQETRADGVIFVFLKFCDPHAFDYPYMRNMLDQAGIPSLLCELEEAQLGEGQLQTRCEAFVEML
jgi:benzoyl-CoA reductase/2-hydroxyglutaryl-CoA dehydratase subunit BcrC/BadD/HgdB